MTKSKAERKLCQVRGCQTPWRDAVAMRCYKHRYQAEAVTMRPAPPSCSTQGCLNPVLKPGRCNDHQYEQYKDLQPEALAMIELGLMQWIAPSADGCWLYENRTMTDKGGYGRFLPDGRWAQVHKWLYMHLVGAVPNGYQMHHSCTIRNCCRPGHLMPLTPEEHAKQTATDMAFRAMFPEERIIGPDRSHSDRERMFARFYSLPEDGMLPVERSLAVLN
jgi:hypothetical protein